MKRKVLWLTASCFALTALVLASCGTAMPTAPTAPTTPTAPITLTIPTSPATPTTPTTSGPETVKVTLKKTNGTVVEKTLEKPKYGGVLNEGWIRSPLYFDEAQGNQYYAATLQLTNESLIIGDWAKGALGTGEASYLYYMVPGLDVQRGGLAESWELSDPNTLVFHIRKGVRFHNKPPTNGRELTADDVVSSLLRLWKTKTAYMFTAAPWDQNIESITAPDKWTVVIKCLPGRAGLIFQRATMYSQITPTEPVQKYGDMSDWRNSCGTGPFMLEDYVSGSSAKFVRNPNYWMTDPIFQGNALPYLDGVKYLIIPDYSTMYAALRTGKVDVWQTGFDKEIGWEDAASLKKTNPELQSIQYPAGSVPVLFWRLDDPSSPFADIRVRKALNMAIDRPTMRDTLYGGKAETMAVPIAPVPEFIDMYTPLDNLPPSTREGYEYHPDKAKQLLAEAGYPNGFKTEVVCWSNDVDLLSVVKAYWAKVGVDLKLDIKEYAVYSSMGNSRSYKELYMNFESATIPFLLTRWKGGYAMLNDPRINETYDKVQASYFDEPKRRQAMKEIAPYILGEFYSMPLLAPALSQFWQPWVRGYHGELMVGYQSSFCDFPRYIWIDQDLKRGQ